MSINNDKLENLVSIIIPVYNSEKTLNRCIKSVIEQSYENIEIIIINDGSTDNSSNICQEYMKKDKRIIVLEQKNSGVSKARNNGIIKAKGKYIAFVDSDDYIEKNMIEILVKNIEENYADISVCNYFKKIDDKNEKKHIINMNINEFSKEVLINKSINGYLWNKIFKADIIKKTNLLSENIFICEDLLFVCEYMKHCKQIVCTEEKLYYYIDDNTYSKPFNAKWKTIINAYEKINDIYIENFKNNINIVEYIVILVCAEIIYKMKKDRYNDSEYKNQIIKIKKMKLKSVLKSNLNEKMKIKALIYNYFPNLVGILKNILKRL